MLYLFRHNSDITKTFLRNCAEQKMIMEMVEYFTREDTNKEVHWWVNVKCQRSSKIE